jgi:hypothetical protein
MSLLYLVGGAVVERSNEPDSGGLAVAYYGRSRVDKGLIS